MKIVESEIPVEWNDNDNSNTIRNTIIEEKRFIKRDAFLNSFMSVLIISNTILWTQSKKI